jgi:hypothetical protein
MVYGGWDPNMEVEGRVDLIFGNSHLLETRIWTWKVRLRPRYERWTAANPANGGMEHVGHSAILAPGRKDGVQVLPFGRCVQGGLFSVLSLNYLVLKGAAIEFRYRNLVLLKNATFFIWCC